MLFFLKVSIQSNAHGLLSEILTVPLTSYPPPPPLLGTKQKKSVFVSSFDSLQFALIIVRDSYCPLTFYNHPPLL